MDKLAISIVRFIDESFPGFVACQFTDFDGHVHTLIDKIPIFTSEDLWWDSEYPRPAEVQCSTLEQWTTPAGQALVRITTVRPDSIESTEGRSEFVVEQSQLHPSPDLE
jgi:hypothetical protein